MKDFGLLVIDKPVGPTSHHVVDIVRRGTHIRKAGHAGTLDPRASGVLVLCLGAATRLSEYLSTSAKRYQAVIRFGATTGTYDADGKVIRSSGKLPTLDQVQANLPAFVGEIEQVPPPYSAVKVRGQRAYDLARAGEDPGLGPRRVTIYRLELLDYHPPDLTIEVECSAGTYIRSLAHDLGQRLGCGGYLASLRRTAAGPFKIEEAVPLAKLETSFASGAWESFLRPAVDALPELPTIMVDQQGLESIRFGHRIPAAPGSSGMARAIGPDGDLLAVLEAVEGGTLWHPRKVFLG
ncbi:MAG TPA: tRNA pseudouridine(55) synthase TruB [Anaerolineales bacterium]|nr:tRNA pseudouridine(55) synthase TruB [Anaerolineales bacterium]